MFYTGIMALECNIDARGKTLRFIGGIFALLGGAVGYYILEGEYLPIPETLGQLGVVAAVIGGAFSIFEARAGWCIVRALGFKTRF
tara:strand:- start:4675 stop:4932 length:258 start_codon:yes stop_codon:yes gene_type:complete